MVLAQGRFWRASVRKGRLAVTLSILRESLPEELEEVRSLKIEVPFEDWHRVVRQIRSDRKLLGGILLDFAKNKDHLSRWPWRVTGCSWHSSGWSDDATLALAGGRVC